MRLEDGKWRCALCGAVMDVPEDALPYVIFSTQSDAPDYRVVMLRSAEIHRCPIEPDDLDAIPIP
jgi:hypothetical protein